MFISVIFEDRKKIKTVFVSRVIYFYYMLIAKNVDVTYCKVIMHRIESECNPDYSFNNCVDQAGNAASESLVSYMFIFYHMGLSKPSFFMILYKYFFTTISYIICFV